MTFFELPSLLWAQYIEYLWYYEPGSWVEASASTFRLAAVFIVMPLAVLVMLASLSLHTVLHVNHTKLISPLSSSFLPVLHIGYIGFRTRAAAHRFFPLSLFTLIDWL